MKFGLQTMVSGGVTSLEVDHKRGVAVVRGRPEAVEEGRKDFQDKLASLFPGDFLSVSRIRVRDTTVIMEAKALPFLWIVAYFSRTCTS